MTGCLKRHSQSRGADSLVECNKEDKNITAAKISGCKFELKISLILAL